MQSAESLKKQALGQTRVFFVALDKKHGLVFSQEDRDEITTSAWRDAANHINRHRIFQRSIDGLKLLSFLAYHAAHKISQTTSHGASVDPLKVACKAGVERLSSLLKLDTSNEIDLDGKTQDYVTNMLYAELTDRCDVGIGPNGLSTTFSFLSKIKSDPDRLSKV